MADQRNIQHSTERPGAGFSGWLALIVCFALLVGAIVSYVSYQPLGILSAVLFIIGAIGFYSLQPNEGAVITLFGRYAGTDRRTGLRWVPFWYARKKVSLRRAM